MSRFRSASLSVLTGLVLLCGCGGGGGGGASTTQTPPAVQGPSALVYGTNPAIYTKGVAIAANNPSSSGGAVVSYSVNPSLPAGLSLNASSGVITGTSTEVMATSSYTVTATNSGGSTPASLSITVNDAAPNGLSYGTNPAVYTKGAAIAANNPTSSGGAVVSYGVSPSLPTGLSLNPTSGVITGIPTAAVTATASYTVTATNSGGSTPASLSITVNDAAPSGLTYGSNPAVYTKAVAIGANIPSSSGGAVVFYSVTPDLPAGLVLDAATGRITGRPTAAAAQGSYVIRAANSGGYATVTLILTVGDPSGTFKIRTGMVSSSATLRGLKEPSVLIQPDVLQFNVGIPATQGGTLMASTSSGTTVQQFYLSTLAPDGKTIWGYGGPSESFLPTDASVVNAHGGFTGGSIDLGAAGMTAPGPGVFMARFGLGVTTEMSVKAQLQTQMLTQVDEIVLRLANPEYPLKDAAAGTANVVTAPHFHYSNGATTTLFAPETSLPNGQRLFAENLTANGTAHALVDMQYLFFVPASKIGAGQSCFVFGGTSIVGTTTYANLGVFDPTGLSVADWIKKSPGLAKALDQFAGSDRTTQRWLGLAAYFNAYITKFMGYGSSIYFSPVTHTLGITNYPSPFEIIALDDANGPMSLAGFATLNLSYNPDPLGTRYTLSGTTLDVSGTPPIKFYTSVSDPSSGTGTVAPAIQAQPAAQSVLAGLTAYYFVLATGTPSPTYQWQRSDDGGSTWASVSVGIGGSTSNFSTLATTAVDSGARFRVVVRNTAGTVISSSALLTVTTPVALGVVLPASQLLQVTTDGTLTAKAMGGVPPYVYSWSKNGSALPAVTVTQCSLPSLRLADQGVYQVQVTDAVGVSARATSKLFVETTANLPASFNPEGLAVSGDDLYLASPSKNIVLWLSAASGTGQQVAIQGAPTSITVDAEGNPWVTLKALGKIAKIDKQTVTVTQVSVGGQPHGIARGLSGAIWFTLQGTNQIGKIGVDGGAPTLYTLSAGAAPTGITVASDGTVWFTEGGKGKVGRLAPGASQVEEWVCPHTNAMPDQIVATSDGRVYYTDGKASAVVMFTVAAQLPGFSSGVPLTQAFAVAVDSHGGPAGIALDGNNQVWLTQKQVGKVTRLSSLSQALALRAAGGSERNASLPGSDAVTGSGSSATYEFTSSQSQPTGIAVAANGSVYATLAGTNQVAQVPTAAAAQSIQVAIQAAEPKRVLKSETLSFEVVVTGSTNPAVTWELVEGSTAGTITAAGSYTAPAKAGTYHVVARSVEDPSKFGRLEVVVYPWNSWPKGQLNILAGNVAGVGNYNGQGSAARFNRPQGVAVDPSGNVFVADSNNLIVRKITPTGLVSTFAGSPGQSGFADGLGAAARFSALGNVAADALGNLYVSDRSSLRKITADGIVSTLAGNPTEFGSTDGLGSAARFRALAYVAADTQGNLYATDAVQHTVRKITAAGLVTTLAGQAEQAGSSDGPGASARFDSPQGIAVDSAGNVYVADQNNRTIRKIDASGVVSTLAGAVGQRDLVDGQGASARFSGPGGLALNATSGHLYVSDGGAIRKITAAGMVSTLAGSGYGASDGQGAAASFRLPEGVAVDSAGNIYVADNLNYTIRKVTPAGLVSTLAGLAGENTSSDGQGSAAGLYEPMGIAVDASGNAYVADTGNALIRKIATDGTVSTLAGSAINSPFSKPQGVAVDAAGNVYVADTANHAIRKVTSGGQVSTLAGLVGTSGSADGSGGTARFNGPQSLLVDAAGNVYVADTGNSTIRRITSSGAVSTLAGTAGQVGFTDGPGTAALFGSPNGVALDGQGNLYISDYWTGAIRKVASDGTVSTVAGLLSQGSPLDGNAGTVGFNHPMGLAVDAAGNLYVADRDNNAIRLILADGFVCTLLGDAAAGINRPGSMRDGGSLPLGDTYGALANPIGVAVGPDGSLFIATGNGVMKVGPTNGLLPPTDLTYSANPAIYNKGTAIAANRPTYSGGAVSSYSVSPSLPVGLSLGASTGVLSGTPSAITASGTYTVTATNSGGSTTASVSITVKEAAPSGLTYGTNPAVYTKGTAIAANTPTSLGGAVMSFSVSPSLPAGLVLNTSTGVITGTPAAVTAQGTYSVTASNNGGFTSANLTITINDLAPATPLVSIDAYVTTGKVGLLASTQDQGLGMSYVWIMAGGTITAGQGTTSIHYTAGAVGSLTATVSVANAVGGASGSAASTVAALPNAELALPTSVHPGDSWMKASLPIQSGVTYMWTIVAGDATATITSGQGTGVIGFAAGASLGTFQIVANLQNEAGDQAVATRTVTVQVGTWVIKDGGPGMATAGSTVTMLPSGRLLMVGGGMYSPPTSYQPVSSVQLFDPAMARWVHQPSMGTARLAHTATLLPSGRLLVVGGRNTSLVAAISSAQLYDPATGTWSPTKSLGMARASHTATLLPNGKVLVAGGIGSSPLASAELYDPESETWSSAGSMLVGHQSHTATLLPSGKVLVSGGMPLTGSTPITTSEIYDPESNTWTSTGSMNTKSYGHTATLLSDGQVLLVGGYDGAMNLTRAERYNPETGIWTATGSLASARNSHRTVLLPSGKVLVTGGNYLATAEVYEPSDGTWRGAGAMGVGRSGHTATLRKDGTVIVVGGVITSYALPFAARAEVYSPATGDWTPLGSQITAGSSHTVTPLPDGRLLAVGGTYNNVQMAGTATYATDTRTWSVSGVMGTARSSHTATLLQSGLVLVAAGNNNAIALASAELYDPASGAWSTTGSLVNARMSHSATLLPNGKVLVVGGRSPTNLLSAELYDPTSGTWTATGSLGTARSSHSSTLLPSGKVLVAGGNAAAAIDGSEVYDPATGVWTTIGSMAAARYGHTATLLGTGKVLASGGGGINGSLLTSTELFDPQAGTWTATGNMTTPRIGHSTVLLQNGQVLVAGGNIYISGTYLLGTTEVYDPTTGLWTPRGSLKAPRYGHTATLLQDGTVLAAFGSGGDVITEIYMHAEAGTAPTGLIYISPQALYINIAILSNGPSHGGGVVTAYTIDPALPAGLTLNATTGVITGTPTEISSTKTYIVTASNAAGSTTAQLSITVDLPSAPTGLIYYANPAVYVRGTGITMNFPAYSGGGATSFSVNPTLPAGLALSSSTGAISGTPSAVAPTATYVVTASNGGGSATANLSITVNDMVPSGLTYGILSAVYGKGIAINPNTPTCGGGAISLYTVSPALPSGLTLNSTTGVISGTPAAISAATTYTVTAANVTGSSTKTLSITVAIGGMTPTGNLHTARSRHEAAILPDGKVLILGGYIGNATAELYDSATGLFTATGSMNVPRNRPTATLLPNGKVLVTGGHDGAQQSVTAELYDPATGTFTLTGSMSVARQWHTATLLPDGRAMIAGGVSDSAYLASVELYDLATGLFSYGGTMTTARAVHTATLLPAGKVLLVAGTNANGAHLSSAELFDPSTGQFVTTGSLGHGAVYHAATGLPDGRVLVTGGQNDTTVFATGYVYEPGSGVFSTTPGMAIERVAHSSTLLPNGRVLIAGGEDNVVNDLTLAEVFDPQTGLFSPTGDMKTPREIHTASLLLNGKVLLAGGYNSAGAVGGAELYDSGDTLPGYPVVSYSLSPYLIYQGVAISAITPASTGASRWSITPALPTGLVQNSGTGVISGTPDATQSATAYWVTASNGVNSSTFIIWIKVNDAAPSGLTYGTSTAVYTKGTTITSNSPTSSDGAVVSYSVVPSLPAGLVLNTSTGVISGTPTAITSSASYTVTATITGGSTQASLTITVNDAAPTSLVYTTSSATYTMSVAITSNSPGNGGGAVVSYGVSPSLPAGLSMSTSTGVISGTPTAITSSASFTVTATNTGGSTQASLTIMVNGAAPTSLVYTTSSATYTKNVAITSNSPGNGGGTVVSYGVSPSLPAGLSMSTSTGVISGTPTAVTASASFTVTATNTGGSTQATMTITVNDAAPTSLVYTTAPAAYTKNVAITSNSPGNGGGTVVSYGVTSSPLLYQGW